MGNRHMLLLITLLTFGSFGVVGDECKYGQRGMLLENTPDCPLFKKDNESPSKSKDYSSNNISLICYLLKPNLKNKADVKDKYGRKIGSIEEENNDKYSLSIDIIEDIAFMEFDARLLPTLNSGTNIKGDVSAFDDKFIINYKPNLGNSSTLIINRYSGYISIDSEIFGGAGNALLDLINAYEGNSNVNKLITGSCEGGGKRKF